jgi:hypothetical protein
MVMVTIEESKDLSQLTVEELMGSLLTHESRFSRNTESLENAFQSQASISRGRGRGNRSRGRRGRGHSQTRERSTSECSEQSEQSEQPQRHSQNQRGRGINFNQSRWTDKSRIQCYYCKKFGHYESECRKKQADLNRGRENVTNTEEGTSESMFFSCQVTEEASNNHDLWLLDSGCNNHMTGNKDLFSSLDSSVTSQIKLGDDYQKKVVGKGIIYVLTKQDEKKDIHDVYYVPGLRHNLMSVGQMNEHGYKVIFEGSKCTILDKPPSKKIIATIQMTKNRMFPLILRNVSLSQSYAQNVSSSDETWLWHLRYGHLPFSSLSLLQKKSMVKGFPIINEQKTLVRVVFWPNTKGIVFPMLPTEKKNTLNWCIHTFVVQCKLSQ